MPKKSAENSAKTSSKSANNAQNKVVRGKPFVKGDPRTSHNGGRPKKSELFLMHSEEIEQELIKIALDPNVRTSERLEALKFIHDKINGKAPQSVDVNADVAAEINNTIEFKGELDEWSK